MAQLRFRVKNYRCFSDQHPAEFVLGDGLTAFVGANNAGKSTLLRLFHETRHIWEALADASNVRRMLEQAGGGEIMASPLDVADPIEILCNENGRDLSIEIGLRDVSLLRLPADAGYVLRLSCARREPARWKFSFTDEFRTRFVEGRTCTIQGSGVLLNAHSREPIADLSELLVSLRALLPIRYVPAFRNAINEGAAAHYGMPVGTSFIERWHHAKNSGAKDQATIIQTVTDEIERIFSFDRLDINASPQHKALVLSVNRRNYRLTEMGAGLAQFILVLGTVALERPGLLLIDEPELNLHASLQLDYLATLAKYARFDTAIATHSLGLARSGAEHIFSLVRTRDGTFCRPLDGTANYAELAGELCYSGFRELGCSKILLVEGVTEVKTVMQFLRHHGIEHEVLLVPLGGGSMINGRVERELEEFTRLRAQVSVLVDSERKSAGEQLDRDHAEFEQICRKLGFNVHITERRATENYFTSRALSAALGRSVSELGPYEPLKDASGHPRWKKSDNWRIAAQMAREELDATDIGQFLAALRA